ncbi:MAG: DUF4231 domain-containing protein [Bacteroidales bacterium]|nr:DUF4231 domain-containing protein [Bacteroidales bacterium]
MSDNKNKVEETPEAENIQPSETHVEENTQSTETSTEKKTEEKSEEETEKKTEDKTEEPKEEPKKETPKESLFYTFDLHKKRASNHERYSTDRFLEYQEWFNNDKKAIIKDFRKLYEANNNDIQVIDEIEDKKKVVIIDFLDWSATLPKWGFWILFHRFCHWVKCLFTNKSRTKEKVKDETKKTPKNLEKEADYLKYRYFVAQQFYSKRADYGKKKFFNSQNLIIIFSAIIPVITLFPPLVNTFIQDLNIGIKEEADKWICPQWIAEVAAIITAILSAIIAIITTREKMYSWRLHWTKNRDLSERLKKEHALYQGSSGEYATVEGEEKDGHKPAERKFRENVEAIIEDGREILNSYGNKKTEEK